MVHYLGVPAGDTVRRTAHAEGKQNHGTTTDVLARR
jgi:hypothetical protein